MQSRTMPPQQGNERTFMFLAIIALFLLLLWIYQPPIIYGCCTLLYHLWTWCDFPRIHPFVAQRINLLAWAGNNANILSWNQFIAVMNRTAGILLAPLSIVVAWGVIAIRNHPMNHTRREINIHTLPHIMARFSPAIIPALCYGDKKTQLLNCDPPEHRSAQAPEEFALQHHLILGQRLDRDKSRTLFNQQLGTPLKGLENFNAHERALVAIFGLQVFLDDRPAAEKLIDNLNRSCLIKSRRDGGQQGYPVLRLADAAFRRVSQSPKTQLWVKRHGTTRTALSALHAQDLRLPGARFRWLKGLDRTLWYALSSSDRSKVFVEGAGVIAVAQWETLGANTAERLNTPVPPTPNRVDSAVDGLEEDLRTLGLVLEDRPAHNADDLEQEEGEDEGADMMMTHPDKPSSIPSDQDKQPIAQQPTSPKATYRAPFRPKKL